MGRGERGQSKLKHHHLGGDRRLEPEAAHLPLKIDTLPPQKKSTWKTFWFVIHVFEFRHVALYDSSSAILPLPMPSHGKKGKRRSLGGSTRVRLQRRGLFLCLLPPLRSHLPSSLLQCGRFEMSRGVWWRGRTRGFHPDSLFRLWLWRRWLPPSPPLLSPVRWWY